MDITINHFTLTTGDNRRSSIEDIEPSLYLTFSRMISPAINSPEPVPFSRENMFLKISLDEDGYLATLYVDYHKEIKKDPDIPQYLPLLLTGGAKDEEYKAELIEYMTTDCLVPIKKQEIYPAAPIIIDRVDVGAFFERLRYIYEWTGDFSRFLGWKLLFPEIIESRMITRGNGK